MSQNSTWRFVLCLLLSLLISSAYAQDATTQEQLIRDLQAQNANLQGRLDRAEASNDRLRTEVSTLESAAMDMDASATAAPADNSAQLARSQAAYDRLKQQMATLQAGNAQLESRIDRELASKSRIQAQLAVLQDSAAVSEAQAEDASTELASLRLQRKNSVRQILDLQRQVAAAPMAATTTETVTTEAAMSASEDDVDVAKLQMERNLAVQRIAGLRDQMSANQEAAAKVQTERDIAVERIAELRGKLGEQQASIDTGTSRIAQLEGQRTEAISNLRTIQADAIRQRLDSEKELARAVKLGDRARAQRAAALEKLKALRNATAEAAPAATPAATVEGTPAENLALYRTLAARINAGETLSSEEQSQFDSLQANQTAAAEAIGGSTYTVVEGDSLSSIAQELYGDGSRYPEILAANDYLTGNPDLIFPGFELVIP